MSGHADTIRKGLGPRWTGRAPDSLTPEFQAAQAGHVALDALVAENQQQAQATKQLAADLADLQLRLIERNAENQQLRDALYAVQITEINGRLCARPEPPDPWFDDPTAPRESKCCDPCRKLWAKIDAVLAPAALAGTPSEDTE